jgi:hypothetical protein
MTANQAGKTHEYGPGVDKEFFNALQMAVEKYPDAARKYAVRSRHLELETLGIDFTKRHGVSRVEDNRIVTEFVDNGDLTIAGSHHACCEWYYDGRWHCIFQCRE